MFFDGKFLIEWRMLKRTSLMMFLEQLMKLNLCDNKRCDCIVRAESFLSECDDVFVLFGLGQNIFATCNGLLVTSSFFATCAQTQNYYALIVHYPY